MKAIVYTSETGHTKAYAELLSKETGLPVLSLADAAGMIPRRSPVLYLGWLKAGSIQGFRKASGLFNIRAVCCVGMGADGAQLPDIRKKHRLPGAFPLFYLQGGYAPEKLRGMNRFMMGMLGKVMLPKLEKKPDITPQEREMAELMKHGGSRVKAENLQPVLEWLHPAEEE